MVKDFPNFKKKEDEKKLCYEVLSVHICIFLYVTAIEWRTISHLKGLAFLRKWRRIFLLIMVEAPTGAATITTTGGMNCSFHLGRKIIIVHSGVGDDEVDYPLLMMG